VIGAIESGYAEVNGLRVFYEIHGECRPVILLPILASFLD